MNLPKMRRFKQALTPETCEEVLRTSRRGVLAMCGKDGQPYAVPLNFIYEDGKIYFHGAKVGWKIDLMKENPRVSFNVIDDGTPVEGKRGLEFQSVTVFGTVREVEDREEALRRCHDLGMKYYPDDPDYVKEDVARNANNVRITELAIEGMTGKHTNES